MEKDESRAFRSYFVSASLCVALCLSAIYLGMAVRSLKLMDEEITAQAQAHFQGILMTRLWNSDHGGVYVVKKPGVESNPYLDDPDLPALDGRTLTLRNPAIMTREISEYAGRNGLFTFHITSLRPINPGNAPDQFEAEALRSFEAGSQESSQTVEQDGRAVFRYMRPLAVEPQCMECHAKQGYTLGQVRGGISVSFDVGEAHRLQRETMIVILALTCLTIILLLSLLYYLFRQMRLKLERIRQELVLQARTDGLTGLHNRRHLLERFEQELERSRREVAPLGCIMLDIDHFKRINDDLGHQAGDRCLRAVAEVLRAHVRAYDVLGRYGGEEFLVVLPGADCAETAVLAERLRQAIETGLGPGIPEMEGRPVTVSLGATVALPGDAGADAVIKRADFALYRAKESGRNRLEVCETDL